MRLELNKEWWEGASELEPPVPESLKLRIEHFFPDEVIFTVIEIQERDWKTFIVELVYFVPLLGVTAYSAPRIYAFYWYCDYLWIA